jgi:hypothetical protein
MVRSSLGRMRDYAWPIAQAAVAAGISRFLAHTVLDHPHPLFAPIAAAVVAIGAGRRPRVPGRQSPRAHDSALEAARQVATGEDLGVADPRVALAAEGVRLSTSDVERIAAPKEAGL